MHHHLMGIGGTGMSTLAELLAKSGATVSGCDLRPSPELAEHLRELGVRVYVGHHPVHLEGVDELIVSSAVTADQPERQEARRRGVAVVHRARALARLLQGRRLVAVAGAHGKTTVTALVAHVFERLGLDPLVAVGFALAGRATGARWGLGEWAVAEVDESDTSFLEFRPSVAVVTNLEPDHLENYGGSFERLRAAYEAFLARVDSERGAWVLGVDSPELERLAAGAGRAGQRACTVTYALHKPAAEAEWTARSVEVRGRGSTFEALYRGKPVARVDLSIPGQHNVANALAVLAVAQLAGLDAQRVARAMGDFGGARRRFEVVAEDARGVLVVDDYAHHPTEIRATLRAAVEGYGRPVLAVFQPHRYHRTALLLEELAASFGQADHLILTDIYAPPPEQPLPGVSGRRLAEAVAARPEWRGRPHHLAFCPTLEEAFQQAMGWARPGTMVLVMGAGDVTRLARRLAEALAWGRSGP